MVESYWGVAGVTATVLVISSGLIYKANRGKSPNDRDKPTISHILLYPVKGCRGIERYSATITDNGLKYDRQYAVIVKSDPKGGYTALSQTKYPKLARVVPMNFDNENITLSAPDQPNLDHRAKLSGKEYTVEFFGDQIQVIDQGEEASSWFSNFLGATVRFVRLSPHADRRTADGKVRPNSFFFRTPLLVMSTESLHDLSANARFKADYARFRPNIVLTGVSKAWEEDNADAIHIGDLRLKGTEHCERCSIPGVDPQTGVLDTVMLGAMRKARAGSTMYAPKYPVKPDEYYVGTYFQPSLVAEKTETRVYIGQEVELYN